MTLTHSVRVRILLPQPKFVVNIDAVSYTHLVKGSLKLQLEMLDVINNLFIEVNPVPVKCAMKELGYRVGNLRLPLAPMEESNLEKLKKSLSDYGVVKL